jgi:SAM-dependent methyltransferase
MNPYKPEQFHPEYISHYADQSVAEAYDHLLSYPDEVFDVLVDLVDDECRIVLDVGCGTGRIARALVSRVERIDAVDCSEAMIAQGKRLPNGNHPNLNWVLDRVETAALNPPYGLVTAGSSLFWMANEVAISRLHDVLTPHGYVVTILPRENPQPWDTDLQRILDQYTVNQEAGALSFSLRGLTIGDRSLDPIRWLESQGLFEKAGEKYTAPTLFQRSLDSYIESLHSRLGFSRERMGPESSAAFDEEVRSLVAPFCENNRIRVQVVGEVMWGKPKKALDL